MQTLRRPSRPSLGREWCRTQPVRVRSRLTRHIRGESLGELRRGVFITEARNSGAQVAPGTNVPGAGDAMQACEAYKQARDAEIRMWAGDPQSHAMVRGGCANVRGAQIPIKHGQSRIHYNYRLERTVRALGWVMSCRMSTLPAGSRKSRAPICAGR
eukprot:COSAG02_NODE_118_length_35376_cov_20.294923_10_plen_157_part_00